MEASKRNEPTDEVDSKGNEKKLSQQIFATDA